MRGTKANSKSVTPPAGKLCKIVTKILSIKIDIIITEYILFSSKLTLFLEKYIIHSNPEKNIAHAGKRIPAIYYHLIIIITCILIILQ